MDQFALAILKVLFPAGIGAISTLGLILLLLLVFPDKVEKWLSMLWKLVEGIGLLYKYASKQRIRLSIQGSVSSFARHLTGALPDSESPAINIEWVQTAHDRKAFLDSGTAVIRLRRTDPNHENIVTACMLYVSQILLRKSVRYLSPTQRDAIQLFVGYKFLQEEAKDVVDVFVEKWLYPGIETENDKIRQYFERFRLLDETDYFTPIFLQELVYLGDKVFGTKHDDHVMNEVDGALQFLEIHINRKPGEKTGQPYYNGQGCRFAIMIVGIQPNILDERFDVYLNHIQSRLLPSSTETIYIVGSERNAAFMDDIARRVNSHYEVRCARNHRVMLLDKSGKRTSVKNHLCVLRSKHPGRYIP